MNTEKITMADVIDKLFKRLSACYGAAWTRQWDGVPIADVKTAWGHELAGYFRNLPAIAFALENLPERCPNVIQFRNLCRAAPAKEVQRIEVVKADPARVAEALAKITEPVKHEHGMKAWAYRLRDRHLAGDRLSLYQISCFKTALVAA